MARMVIEEVIEHLRDEFTRALSDAVDSVLPTAVFSDRALYEAFKLAVYRRCNTWEYVPDRLIVDWEE